MPILGSIIKTAIELRGKNLEERRKFNPYQMQLRVLKRLLRKAQFTAFGEHFGFNELLRNPDQVQAYREKVPTYDYNSIYKDWWYRMLNGEPYVTWPGRVKYFALSSGTSESSSKHIPVTPEMIKAMRKVSVRQLVSLSNFNFSNEFFQKGILMLGGSTHLQYNGTYYEGDLSGINTAKIPFWFQHHYKPGRRISKERDWNTKLEEIIKNAHEWDIGAIVGVPAWYQILLERIIDRYKLDTIHDLWPNLQVFCHGGVAFGPYRNSFQRLIGKPITYIETYLASEGFIAFQGKPETNSMQMMVDSGIFFEFVPFNATNFDNEGNMKKNPETLIINEVEEGKEYALLLSSVAGAWRYLIGDTIKFTSKEKCEIIITGRTKHFLNICGEHLSQENMNRAVEMLEDDMNVDIREFTVAGTRSGTMFAHKWYLGTNDVLDPQQAAMKLDVNLKKLNDDYRVERIAAIRDVKAVVLPLDTFYDFLRMKGKEGAQNKFPRVLIKEQHKEWLNFLEQRNLTEK